MTTFTLMGYTVTNADQARSILVIAMLKGNKVVAEQCCAVIKKFDFYAMADRAEQNNW